MWRQYAASIAVYIFYRFLMLTWRISLDECESFQKALKEKTPVILAHWHGDELAVIHLVKRYRIATITSTSKDGEIMNRVLQWLGAETSRGSSTRGGANALRGIISHCRKNGNNVSFAVDGPKGPIYKVKPGVFEFSRLMNAPIYAVSVGISKPWIFSRSWNKCALPGFFSRVNVLVREGMPAIHKAIDPRDPELAAQLENMLAAGKRQQCVEVARDRP
jgi:hypothetical protein